MKKIILTLVLAATTLGGVAFGQSNFGHIDTQKVLDTMPSRKTAMMELEKFEARAVRELQETQKKLQADYAKLQEEGASMSKTAYEWEEERLMKKSQEFQTRQQELDQQMKVLGDELNAPILTLIKEAVSKVSKVEKLNYVLDVSTLLYSDGKDITDKVIKEVLKVEAEAKAKAASTTKE